MSATTITICNNKGGVGKTFLVWASAVQLAAGGSKVLCIDTDPQGSLSNTLTQSWAWEGSVGRGFRPRLESRIAYEGTAAKDLFNPDYSLGELAAMRATHGIDLFYTQPNDFSSVPIFNPSERGEESAAHFKQALDAVSGYYDYVFIDVPPFAGKQALTAMFYADYMVVPLQVASHAVKGTEGEVEMFRRIGRQDAMLGVVLNHVKRGSAFHRAAERELREALGERVFPQVIHDSVTIDAATAYNTPLQRIPGSRAARVEVEGVIHEMISRIKAREAQKKQKEAV